MIVELHKLGFEEKLSRGKIFPRSYYSESNIYIYIYIYIFIYFLFFIFFIFCSSLRSGFLVCRILKNLGYKI